MNPTPLNPITVTPSLLSAAQITQEAEEYGLHKVDKPPFNSFLMAIPAGVFIGLAFVFYITVTTGATPEAWGSSHLAGGLAFSLGLILIVVCGGDLFTSTALATMARASKRISTGSMLGCWLRVYAGNLVGALFLVALIATAKMHLLDHGQWGLNALHVAQHKLHHSFWEALALGILCNMLVCLGIWMSLSSKDMLTRALMVVLPVAMFVSSGFEHCVANMFMVPIAITIKSIAGAEFWHMVGADPSLFADLTVKHFILANLIPVTIGNIIGGGFVVGLYHWMLYRRPAHLDSQSTDHNHPKHGANRIMNTYIASTSVRTLMRTPPVELRPEQSLRIALNQLLDAGITAAPVTDEQHSLLGLVTEENILQALWASDFEAETLSECLVAEIMQRETARISPSDSLSELVDHITIDSDATYPVSTTGILLSHSHSSLEQRAAAAKAVYPEIFPVTEQGKLVGIITRHDLLQAMLPTPQAKGSEGMREQSAA